MMRSLTLFLALWLPQLATAQNTDVMRVLHMLDYIGVDYGEFVRDGEILDPLEYAEQQNFSAAILARLRSLPDKPQRQQLLDAAQALSQAIDNRVSGKQIKQMTGALATDVLRAYPIPMAPRQAPDLSQAPALFESHCSACHGRQGHGDGLAGVGLEPAPTNFHDAQRQQQRSVFGLYNVISNGVADTGMPPFQSLSEQQRWALAFFVGQLIYDDPTRQQGRELFESGYRAGLDDLGSLSNALPESVATAHPGKGLAVLAYLRANPRALLGTGSALELARSQIQRAAQAWADGRKREAVDAALAAYLDGYEIQEAAVAAVAPELNRQIEAQMLDLRRALERNADLTEIERRTTEIDDLLAKAQQRISERSLSASSVLIGSFVILAREGLEAILVLAALFAFLAKVGRQDAVRYVHAGWISALGAGVLTWFVAQHFIAISGASRELTEGVSALLAAVVLLSVGLWMHNKSLSGQWQQYIARKMEGALDGGRMWGLAALAFIATYREVFETVLFYQALWNQGHHAALLGGFLLGCVALIALAALILKASRRLPLQQFFSVSAILVIVLAVVFTGQGIQALQEAGTLSSGAIRFISIPLLGIYPNWQGLLAQGLLAAVACLVLMRGRRTTAA